MAKARSSSVLASVDAVMNSLRMQGIAFHGPLCTPGKRTVFVVESCIILESELLDLFAENKLDRDGIQELAKRIEARNSSQLQ
jgi:hypothetical protein